MRASPRVANLFCASTLTRLRALHSGSSLALLLLPLQRLHSSPSLFSSISQLLRLFRCRGLRAGVSQPGEPLGRQLGVRVSVKRAPLNCAAYSRAVLASDIVLPPDVVLANQSAPLRPVHKSRPEQPCGHPPEGWARCCTKHSGPVHNRHTGSEEVSSASGPAKGSKMASELGPAAESITPLTPAVRGLGLVVAAAVQHVLVVDQPRRRWYAKITVHAWGALRRRLGRVDTLPGHRQGACCRTLEAAAQAAVVAP